MVYEACIVNTNSIQQVGKLNKLPFGEIDQVTGGDGCRWARLRFSLGDNNGRNLGRSFLRTSDLMIDLFLTI